jgi:hypothetical protein
VSAAPWGEAVRGRETGPRHFLAGGRIFLFPVAPELRRTQPHLWGNKKAFRNSLLRKALVVEDIGLEPTTF